MMASFMVLSQYAKSEVGDSLQVSRTSIEKESGISSSVKVAEVVVTGTRQKTDIRHLPMTVSIVGKEVLTQRQQPNVMPTLSETVPGLFVTSRGMMGYGVSNGAAGGIMLRGISGGAGQVMVMIDGHPQYNGIYGHPIADTYQSLYAQQVEVLRGPASVLYGSNAMGGVINIVTDKDSQKGHHLDASLGTGSYGTVQGDLAYRMNGEKLSASVGGQYMRSDNHRPHMGFEQYGGFGKLSYAISQNWNAWADINVTRYNSSYPGAVDVPMLEADQWITRGFATAAVEHEYENTSGRVSFYSTYGWHKINDGYKANDPSAKPQARYFRSKDALTGVSAYESFKLYEGNRLTVGIDYQKIYGNAYYTSRATGEVLETQNKQSGRVDNNEIAAYVDFRQDIMDWLTIDAGIRWDKHNVTGDEWIPQIGLVVRPVESADLKATISKGFRNPTMREMYLYPPSNEELMPEKMMNYEIAWKQRFTSFSYGINLFLIDADNIIQTVERKNVNTGEIKNKGVEAEATWAINKNWRLTTNHSFLNMKYHVLAAPEYKGMIGVNYASERWNAGVGVQQLAGLFTVTGANEHKENATLVNMNVGFHATKAITLWMRGENLLGEKYEVIAGYPMPKATFMGGLKIRI